MTASRRGVLLMPLALALVPPATAQSPAGTWDGIVGGERITVTLDSGAAGWRGVLLAPGFRAEVIALASVTVRGDTIVLGLPADASGAVLRGTLSPERDRFGGVVIVGMDSTSLFRLARRGSAAAELLLAQLAPPGTARRAHASPDSARLVTSDITLFWSVLDQTPPDSLEAGLQTAYLASGTPGLRDFIRGRIVSAADLARRVQAERGRYDARRAATLRVAEAEPGIRAAFRTLESLYAEAVFPDVYFVIGRFNSGGTVSANGLLIGAEMFDDPARLPGIVAHEVIHFQQGSRTGPPSLLSQAVREGAADFVGEMITGQQLNSEAHRYGLAHERALWAEFRERMHGSSYAGWLYGDPPGERPADLGYFIGYRIAQAYYGRAADRSAALRTIIRGVEVETILAQSGYDP
jgi:hypothetical protein